MSNPQNQRKTQETITVYDDLYPAAPGTRAILALEQPVKTGIWPFIRLSYVKETPILFWAVIGTIGAHGRGSDQVVGLIRYGAGLVPVTLVNNLVAVALPDQKLSLFEQAAKAKADHLTAMRLQQEAATTQALSELKGRLN